MINATELEIADDCVWGNNISIDVRGSFQVGKRCRFGDNIHIRGNNVILGDDLFCSGGLRIGGGGRQHPNANLKIGNRCTIHNNFINICEPVVIGDDVGLSPDVSILTHGYWLSVFRGFPAKFQGVIINNGAIIGYRTVIMMGVKIGENCVIGANSTVTKNTKPNSVYAGTPAKFIRDIKPLSEMDCKKMLNHILNEYRAIAECHGIRPKIHVAYPLVYVNRCKFNVLDLTVDGDEDRETDDFRDYVRKWGLRFYTDRPFRSVW